MRRFRSLALALESSCDDSCFSYNTSKLSGFFARIYKLKHKVSLDIYGGVVPKISSELHVKAFSKLSVLPKLVAYTHGPGIFECLQASKKYIDRNPINSLPVNHVHAHVVVALPKPVEYPFLTLIISGGHTIISLCTSPGRYIIMGQTYDDSFGECYDKVLRGILPNKQSTLFYNNIERMYSKSSAHLENHFSLPLNNESPKSLNFSFCGLKTHYKTILQNGELDECDIVKLFINNMCELVKQKLQSSVVVLDSSPLKPKFIVVGGGSSANFLLRQNIGEWFDKELSVYLCDPRFCGDNAHMIYKAAIYDVTNNCKYITSKKPTVKWGLNELKADE